MSKELSPLEALNWLVYGLTNNNYAKEELPLTMSKAREIITNALKRLDELDTWINQSNTTKIKALNNKLKALEIIKEKTLTINDLYWLKNGDYREYRKNLETLYSGVEEEHLQKILKTQEEFDLLKEVLL